MTSIGVLGAGQLGRMLALAGYPLGLEFRFLDPAEDSPAGHLAPHITANYYDDEVLPHFLDGLDVVTYEFENVPVEVAHKIEKQIPVYPPSMALEKAQDRLIEKSFFRSLGLPTPEFAAAREGGVGFPAMLKTRRMGYDGKGQYVVNNEKEFAEAMDQLQGQDAILEQFIEFDREVSIIATRGRDGMVAFYPLVENTHQDGILHLSVVWLTLHPLQAQAESYAKTVMDALDYVGVLAIEFFEKDGQLFVNEMAPRVHNSGHWTIEGSITSQFENHVRAVSDRPLGCTNLLGACGMVNLIGTVSIESDILKIEGAHLHLYGKSPRPGRKLGHVTVVAESDSELMRKIERLKGVVGNH